MLFLFLCMPLVAADITWPVENRILQLRPPAQRSESPPSYMVHLYNRYRKGRMPYTAANTVRSFFPVPGRLGNDEVLVFNLTGVHPTEYVEKVDLHMQSKGRQRGKSDQKKVQLQLEVLDLGRPLRPKVDSIPLARTQSGGWQTLDITDSVIACLEGEAEQHHLIGVSLRGSDNAFLSDVVNQPFMVLFSEDDDHLNIDELDNSMSRFKREILDNELPDFLPDQVDGSLKEVQARLKYKSLDSAVIPKPEARKGLKMDSEKHRKRRRRRKKEKRLPYAWGKTWWRKEDLKGNPDYEGDEEEDYEDVLTEDESTCQKRKMVVNFAELGWGDWIISPKSFDASYCSGDCDYPLKKSVKPSNHATIQSLLYTSGLRKGVPGLCCVPHTLTPISLLYYDHNRNVVLKSFPNMNVETCSCR